MRYGGRQGAAVLNEQRGVVLDERRRHVVTTHRHCGVVSRLLQAKDASQPSAESAECACGRGHGRNSGLLLQLAPTRPTRAPIAVVNCKSGKNSGSNGVI